MAKWEALESTEERDQEVVTGHDLLFDGHFIGFIAGDIVSLPNIGEKIARKLNAFDEMLAALKEIQMIDDSGPSGLTWIGLGNARNIASDAIAKAEGK